MHVDIPGNSRLSAAIAMAEQVFIPRRPAFARLGLLALAALTIAACAGRPGPRTGPNGAPGAPPAANPRFGEIPGQADQLRSLQQLGILANGLPLPFTGSVAVLPGPSADSVYVVVSLSMPTISFSFTRENDRYRGSYSVAVEARQNGNVVNRVESSQTVRVMSFKETQRGDESVLFQQLMLVAPGSYSLTVLVRDGQTSRSGTQEKTIEVPRFSGQPATPVIAFEVSPRASSTTAPDFLANARSTVVLGRDADFPVYLEVLDPAAQGGVPLMLAIRDGKGAELWQDSVMLPKRGNLASGVIRVPVATLGVGVVQAAVWRVGGRDTVTQPVLISFGDDLPVASFDDMIAYLRFFASNSRLNALKTGSPQARAAAWATFLRETDPISITPQNEALRDYFNRIRTANIRFKDDGAAGWLSDRGSVYVAFGEPDQIVDQNNQGQQDLSVGQRNRIQIWDYTSERLRLVFLDQSGFGRWRFAGNGLNEFQSALQRRLAR